MFRYPYMVINVSVQYYGGLLPDIILLLTLCDHIGEPFQYNEELFLSLQPMFPPTRQGKRFD